MAALAERVCDTALHAEAQKIERLVREKMTSLSHNDFGVTGGAASAIDLLRTAAQIHRRYKTPTRAPLCNAEARGEVMNEPRSRYADGAIELNSRT
jgi:hypothetical protein